MGRLASWLDLGPASPLWICLVITVLCLALVTITGPDRHLQIDFFTWPALLEQPCLISWNLGKSKWPFPGQACSSYFQRWQEKALGGKVPYLYLIPSHPVGSPSYSLKEFQSRVEMQDQTVLYLYLVFCSSYTTHCNSKSLYQGKTWLTICVCIILEKLEDEED